MNQPIHLLLIEYDESAYHTTRDILSKSTTHTFDIDWTQDKASALQALQKKDYDICLADYDLGMENGLEVLKDARTRNINLPMILMTPENGTPIHLNGDDYGKIDVVRRPSSHTDMLERTIVMHVEREHQNEQLRQRIAELEGRVRDLDAYNHTIAHGLISPLSLLAGYSSLILLEDDLSADVHEWASKIRMCSEKMSDMINQLLWLAQEQETIISAQVNVEPVIKDALLRLEHQIKQKGVKIEIDYPLPAVLGQRVWVEEIFANLIGNAIKYMGFENTDPKIRLSGEVDGDFSVYRVADNGIGIKPDDQKQIFEMFTRIGHHREMVNGLGLGLSIVKRIIAKLEGEIGVESTLGQGSVFWFRLPHAPPN